MAHCFALNDCTYSFEFWHFVVVLKGASKIVILTLGVGCYMLCVTHFYAMGNHHVKLKYIWRERSGSVVERLSRDRRAAGSSLTGVTALCP